jgi:hypothetical protein
MLSRMWRKLLTPANVSGRGFSGASYLSVRHTAVRGPVSEAENKRACQKQH